VSCGSITAKAASTCRDSSPGTGILTLFEVPPGSCRHGRKRCRAARACVSRTANRALWFLWRGTGRDLTVTPSRLVSPSYGYPAAGTVFPAATSGAHRSVLDLSFSERNPSCVNPSEHQRRGGSRAAVGAPDRGTRRRPWSECVTRSSAWSLRSRRCESAPSSAPDITLAERAVRLPARWPVPLREASARDPAQAVSVCSGSRDQMHRLPLAGARAGRFPAPTNAISRDGKRRLFGSREGDCRRGRPSRIWRRTIRACAAARPGEPTPTTSRGGRNLVLDPHSSPGCDWISRVRDGWRHCDARCPPRWRRNWASGSACSASV